MDRLIRKGIYGLMDPAEVSKALSLISYSNQEVKYDTISKIRAMIDSGHASALVDAEVLEQLQTIVSIRDTTMPRVTSIANDTLQELQRRM